MGVFKPTRSSKSQAAVSVRRPTERWCPSSPASQASIKNGSEAEFEADLHPPRRLELRSHSHSNMKGGGLSVPGKTMTRRAGFRRKLKRAI
jgi:hypothetical protein